LACCECVLEDLLSHLHREESESDQTLCIRHLKRELVGRLKIGGSLIGMKWDYLEISIV
jgi:hypothetical protein